MNKQNKSEKLMKIMLNNYIWHINNVRNRRYCCRWRNNYPRKMENYVWKEKRKYLNYMGRLRDLRTLLKIEIKRLAICKVCQMDKKKKLMRS